MTSHALHLTSRRMKRHALEHRRRRRPGVGDELLSVAGIVGSPVYDTTGTRIGSLDDLVVRWDPGEPHPPLSGALIRARRRRSFVPVSAIEALMPDCVRLAEHVDSRPVERQPSLIALAHDVLDRQIVDVGGVNIDRVSDLVLGRTLDGIRLVGADVSARTLIRRLGPAPLRRRIAPDRVYDWASVAAFSIRGPGEAGSVLRLASASAELAVLRPEELERLLSDLPAGERKQLAAHVAGRSG